MSLGKWAIISTSIKQKMNTKSSTETELIAAENLMPHILWMNYFLNWQGYNAKDTILYQDNKSAILLKTLVRITAAKEQSTSPSDITSSLTESRLMSWKSSIVPQEKWLQTISRSHCKVQNSINSAKELWT